MTPLIASSPRPSVAIPESHHWYRADGSPQYNSPLAKPAKDGRTTTATTVAHAKKQLAETGTGLFPSYTTVKKYALPTPYNVMKWQLNHAADAGIEVGRAHPDWTDDQCREAVNELYQTRTTEQADRGTLIHAEVERSLTDNVPPEDHAANLADAQIRGWAKMGSRMVDCELSFASTLGWAGKCDLLIANVDGLSWTLADLKCPNTNSWTRFKTASEKGHQVGYDEYGIQLAAYRAGLGQPHPEMKCDRRIISRCVSILVDGGEDSDTAGECLFYEWPHDTLLRFGRVFARAFENWVELRGYDPRPDDKEE